MFAWARRLMRKTGAAPISSSHPASLTAQQQVIEVDGDLLREVLLFFGTDDSECHAALLVNRFWTKALNGKEIRPCEAI